MKLVICEKPSVGATIAAALGISKRKDGYFEGGDYIISWCIGHLVTLAEAASYEERYKKWNYSDLPIIPGEFKFSLYKDKKDQFKVLKDLMERRDVTSLVNACDAGREGELIFRLVMMAAGCEKPIERLWISSMEDRAIIDGFENLKDGKDYDALYASALARQKADWLIGINASRLFSLLYKAQLSVGRVQSPTVAMLVERQGKIDSFEKEKYHLLHLTIDSADAVSEKFTDMQAAINTLDELRGKEALCKSAQTEKKAQKPQKLYDLTTLQRDANRIFGYTASQTLDYAQALYEKKLLTYPRTDSRFLTSDMEETAKAILSLIRAKEPFDKCQAFEANIKGLVNDKGVSDHHAIIPTAEIGKYDIALLPKQERYLLFLVMNRMLSASAEPHVYEVITAKFECGGTEFTAKGKRILHEGFKEIEAKFRSLFKSKEEKEDGEEAEQVLPAFDEGKAYQAEAMSMTEHFTSPPKNYTEDTLLSAMENAGSEEMPDEAERKGLGTPATRASIIEKVITMGFVERKGKSMIPTEKGKNLIKVLPEILTSPLMTADWEDKLVKISKGELSEEAFLSELCESIRNLVKENTSVSEENLKLFSPERISLGKCPRCGGDVYEGAQGYFCSNRECRFSIWKDNKYLSSRKVKLTPKMVEALLTKGKTSVKGMWSEQKQKSYDGILVLDDTGDKYVNFKIEFEQKRGKSR